MIGTKLVKEQFSDEDYAEAARWCNNTQKARIEDKGDYYEVVEILLPEVTLPEAKAAKLSEINSACDAILNQAVASYPQSEILTFDQQVEEVKAYQQTGNPASAPLLSALAGARGISLDELCLRVITKRAQFSTLSGIIIGQRQHLEDVLDTLETVEAVQALEVDIRLPETPNEENEAAEESGFFDEVTDGAE